MPTRETDRVAGAAVQLFESLDTRLGELQRAVEKLRDEARTDARQIENQVQELSGELRQMRGENIRETVAENKALLIDLEKRVRAIENWQNNLMGRLAIVAVAYGTLMTIIVGVVVKWLTK